MGIINHAFIASSVNHSDTAQHYQRLVKQVSCYKTILLILIMFFIPFTIPNIPTALEEKTNNEY